MRRLEELLREMRNAAHAIGNTALKEKFDEGRQRLKRDIVFAASLYLCVLIRTLCIKQLSLCPILFLMPSRTGLGLAS